jgi:hypothetical protein
LGEEKKRYEVRRYKYIKFFEADPIIQTLKGREGGVFF